MMTSFPVPDYMKLNLAYQRLEFEEAILNYSKAIPWNPKDANPYFWRGHAKVSIEQYMKAIDDFDEVIRISGDEASVYHIRGYAKSCTAIGFLDHTLKEDCATIQSH